MMRSIQETEEQEHTDTEITLGMKSLLGVFFGLVLICGVFFGFGYSLGRGSSSIPSRSTSSEPAGGTTPSKRAVQPSLAPAVSQASSGSASSAQTSAEPVRSATREAESIPVTPRKPSASVIKPVSQDSEVAASSAPSKPVPAAAMPSTVTPATSKALPAVASTSSAASGAQAAAPTASTPAVPTPAVPTMVQIAAVSRQEDADVLVAALKKRGYNVIVRNEPRDSLLHVQIGPFATRDEAKAMRAKLLADGYNAILK